MYEYDFVRIEVKRFWRPKLIGQDYHLIIKERSEQGWKLIQIFAPGMGTGAHPIYFELIFERQVKN